MGFRTFPKSRRALMTSLAALIGVAACGGSAGSPTTIAPTTTTMPVTTAPSTTAPAGPVIDVSPQFIQGVIPGADLKLLVTLADATAGPVTLSAEAPGAAVTVAPTRISQGDVAEVSIVPAPVAGESEVTVAITPSPPGPAGTVHRTLTVVPWEDDRGEQAAEVLALFTAWLEANRPELGVDSGTELTGTFVAPLLLVVSHYAFFSDDWELGLSWHVMVPPDDFAELYLRPRAELAPTHAFRIGSWQTALDTGTAEVTEVEPPLEVVR